MHYSFKRAVAPLLTLVLCIFVLTYCQAQAPDVTPQSPNAAGLGKYGDIPVSYATGIPSVSIPLCDIKGKNLSLPISLNYHASGIKVDELSSNVGLGWSLSAGGVITRTVVGKPDEKTNGYATYAFDPNNSDHLTKAAEGKYDTEPDMFYFNVAGFSGKFFVEPKAADGNYVIKLVPYQDIQIVWRGTNEWTLIDPSGTEYLFNVPEETYTEVECETSESITPPVVTSWYLKRIKHPSGEEINFTYTNEPFTYRQSLTESRYLGIQTSNSKLPDGGVIAHCYTSLSVDGVRVTEIKSAFEKLIFSYATTRQDIGGHALSSCELQVLTPTNTYKSVKKFNLTQDHFTSILSTAIVEEGKRLKLTGVQEIGFDANNAETSLPPHTITYLEDDNYNLPPRLSLKQDHWGFANDNTASTLIPKDVAIPELVNGANRNTHSEKVKSGMIRRITYPTSGYTEFDFEAHTAYSTNASLFYDEEVSHSAHANVRNATGQTGFKSDKSPFTILPISPNSTSKIPVTVSWATYNTAFNGDGDYDVAIYKKNDYAVPVWQGGGLTRGQSSLILLAAGDYEVYAEVNLPNDNASVSVTWKTYERLSVQDGQDAGNATVGGVRIKRIKSYTTATAQPIIKRFDYIADGETTKTSGLLTSIPKYTFPYSTYIQTWGESSSPTALKINSFQITLHNKSVSTSSTFVYFSVGSIITTNVPPTGTLLYEDIGSFGGYNSSSKVPLGSTQGSPVYYTKVTIYNDDNGDNGKSDVFYTEKKDALNYVYPYVQHDSYDWQRGLLEKQIDYKKTPTGYVEIKRLTNTYKFDRLNPNDNSLSTVHNYTKKGYSVVFYPANPSSRLTNAIHQVKINSHRIMSPWVSLAQTKVVQDGVESVVNYTYDETNGLHSKP